MGNEKVCSLRMDCGSYSRNVRCCERVGEDLSDEYDEGKVGVHQGSVLRSQLFIVVLDAFSKWMGRFQLFAFTTEEMDDALDQANYRGLKLTEQAMKVIERIAYSLVRQLMTIDWDTLGGPLCR